MNTIVFFITFILSFNLLFLCNARDKVKKEVKEGNLLYNEGKFEDALEKYEKAYLDNPDSDIVNFNLGAGLYKNDEYEKALEHFKRSLLTDDQELEQKANYNLANSEYKLGISRENEDLENAVKLLGESLRHYENSSELNPDDEDVSYNYEFVEKELKRLKEKLEQQKQEQQSQDQQDKEEDDQNQESSNSQEQESQSSQANQEESDKDSRQGEEKEDKGQDDQGMGKEQAQDDGDQTRNQEESQLSESQARMLLEGYSQDEEPKGLYQQKLPKGLDVDVLKDW